MPLKILIASFAIVFLAELGDKTQLAAFAFTTSSRSPVMVFIGTSLALVASSAVAVFLGHVITQYVPQNILQIVSATLFILIGVILLVNIARKAPEETEETREAGIIEGGLARAIAHEAKVFEEDIAVYFEDLASQVSDQSTSEMLRELAKEERQHFHQLEAAAVGGKDEEEVSDKDVMKAKQEAGLPEMPAKENLQRDSAVGRTENRADANQEVLEKALQTEQQMADFYLGMSLRSAIPEVKHTFQRLASEELDHVERMRQVIEA